MYMPTISSLVPSPLKTKRFRVLLSDGKHYDFGSPSPPSKTYIDHKDIKKRDAYRKRHYALEKEQIDTYTPSPAVFSYFVLWGDSTDIKKNIEALNKKLSK